MRATLKDWEYKGIRKFQKVMVERIEVGRRKYGMNYIRGRDNLKELQDELLDVANYALLEWLHIERMRNEKIPAKLCRAN